MKSTGKCVGAGLELNPPVAGLSTPKSASTVGTIHTLSKTHTLNLMAVHGCSKILLTENVALHFLLGRTCYRKEAQKHRLVTKETEEASHSFWTHAGAPVGRQWVLF